MIKPRQPASENITARAPEQALSAGWIASLPDRQRAQILATLNEAQCENLLGDWRFWAHPAQTPPPGDWRVWVFLGGRGAGKTWAGANFLLEETRDRPGRYGLVGPDIGFVRDVMIEGESGLIACAPRQSRPRYEPTRRRLIFDNGSEAWGFSAVDADSLRGPQFHGAWGDEFCAWPHAGKALAMLRLGLRLGRAPRLALTTTPRPLPALTALLEESQTVMTHAPTAANAANLAAGFVETLSRAYAGQLARQELGGEIIDEAQGALWRRAELEAARVGNAPALERVVVAVDPPAGESPLSVCGIAAAGACGEGARRTAYVLGDFSIAGAAPDAWARRASEAAQLVGAEMILVEDNQGGAMAQAVLAASAVALPIQRVRARINKRARAAPIAALMAQGRVKLAGSFPGLEDEMCAFGAEGFQRSPDPLDAMVWAVWALIGAGAGAPRVRPM